jgi:GNAT superfamily N-acetyltransferase
MVGRSIQIKTPLRYTTRKLQPGDEVRLAELAGQLGYPSTPEQIRVRLEKMQDPNEHAVYVAEMSDGYVAGWIGVSIFRAVEVDCCVEITGLIVDQEIRSRGIGKVLIDAAEQWARQRGCDAIRVRSNVIRDRAHLFYQRNGYECVKTQVSLHKDL